MLKDMSLNENEIEEVMNKYLESVLKILQDIITVFEIDIQFKEEILMKYVEVAKVINVFYPQVSDSSLFEIDDQLLQYKPSAKNLITELEELKTLKVSYEGFKITNFPILSEISIAYCKIYLKSASRLIRVPMDLNVDNAFIRLISNVETRKKLSDISPLIVPIERFLRSRNKQHICAALKFLKIIFDISSECEDLCITKYEIYYKYVLMQLSEFRTIPHARHSDTNRISLFIANHSCNIYDKLYNILFSMDKQLDEFLEPYKNGLFRSSYLNALFGSSDVWREVSKFDIFCKLFTSLTHENERFDLLERFLIGENKPIKARFQTFEKIINTFVYNIWGVSYQYKTLENEMRYIDAHYGYNFGTCLSEKMHQSINCNTLNAIKNSIDPEDDSKNDYHVEKFLVYDYFMNLLQGLNFIYTARKKYEDIFKRKTNDDLLTDSEIQLMLETKIFESNVFRLNRVNPFIREVNYALCDPSKRGHLSWYLEIIIDKLPFLILHPENGHMTEDIKKMLKGELIDDVIEKNLFSVIRTIEDLVY